MDFVSGLSILADKKSDIYNLILVIIDRLMKMVHYEPIKVTINARGLAKGISDVVVRHHRIPESIITDKSLLFTSKF